MLLALTVTILAKLELSSVAAVVVLFSSQVLFYKSERAFLEKHKR